MRGQVVMSERDLGARVFVLESKQEEYDRRQREQEERQRVHEDLIQEIARNTAVTNNTLEMLANQVLPNFAALEKQVIENSMITRAVAWFTAAVVTGGIAAAFALIS